MRIVVEGETAEKLVQDLDGKEKYVSTLVSILEDVGWIEQGNSEAQMYRHNKSLRC
jgi:hypothetical protein